MIMYESMTQYTIVGLGELLWDCLPTGRKLGGAPANFAYHANILGNRGVVATRVGTDALGEEAEDILRNVGLNVSHIQHDAEHATGTVDVILDERGQAEYVFASNTAWDNMELTPEWIGLAQSVDAVCFGSLGQRSDTSRNTIIGFLESLKPGTLRVFDVNMRQNFYNKEIIEASLKLCEILKLNEQELPVMAEMFSIPWTTEKDALRTLREQHDLTMICYTRSDKGAYFITATEDLDHPGYRVQVADTIGAGDAFTATVVHEFLQKKTLKDIAEAAARRGAWVASQSGAMPTPSSYNDALFS